MPCGTTCCFRGDDGVYEVGPADVRITDEAKIWPQDAAEAEERPHLDGARRERAGHRPAAHDQQVLGAMYPSLKPRLSGAVGGRFSGKGRCRWSTERRRSYACWKSKTGRTLAYYPRVDAGLGGGGRAVRGRRFQSASEGRACARTQTEQGDLRIGRRTGGMKDDGAV